MLGILRLDMLVEQETDHCTLFPDGSWAECCARHDRRYDNKRITREQADELLFRCVVRKSNKVVAYIVYAGVRAFGWYYYDKANDPVVTQGERNA